MVATRSRSRSATRARLDARHDRAAGVDERLDGEVVARPTWPSRSSSGVASIVGRPLVQHLGRRRLGRGHVGLVEGLDAEQRAGQGGGQLPQQHLAAEVGERAVERQDRPPGWPASASAASSAARCRRRAPRTGGRRRRRRARRAARRRPGPRRCRPCRSTRRSAARATGRTWPRPSGATMVSLSRPLRTPAAIAAARRAAGLPAAARPQPVGHGGGRAEQPGDVGAGQQRRDEAEVATAPSSGRRCRAGSRRWRRSPGRPPARPGRCPGR